MRAIWTGAVTFGLVNVPVKLYSATEDHSVKLHMVHDSDGGRIRYERKCEKCGKKIPWENIDKAFDDGEQTVILTDEDLDSLPAERSKEIVVEQFVPSDQIEPMLLGSSYYLEPDGKSPKAYLLLRETLKKTDRTAVVTFALRQKTRLGALRVKDKVLVLQALLWSDEVREADFPATRSRAKISDQELKMSAALVEQFSSDFTPENYTDEYQEELRKLIETKLEQGDAVDTEETFGESGEDEGQDAEVVDLMEALKKSIAARKEKKGGAKGSGAKSSGAKGSGARSSGSAKKSTTRKTATKSAPAKKGA
ncbi:MAG TPA: Ku protein [Actinomycetales bacterium]|nr:Ku protein [Actinomycetales bacterium]